MRTTRETAVAIRAEHLIARYRGVICDLDGVVYWGTAAVPGAVDTLNHVVADGRAVAFATNNASRSPIAVAKHLRELGVGGRGWSVITSSQAAAAYLAERLDPGAPVLAVGGPGVAVALAEAGLAPVRVSELADTQVEAMVQGLGVDVTWRELAEVGYLAQRGVTWVATNLDLFLPTARGPAPGNGALVAAVRTTTTRTPHVTGKPGAALFELARTRLGTHHARTLVCGDRLDTDIAGANAAGVDSLFVLSGAHRLQDLAFAAKAARPTYVASDLTGLLEPGLRLDAVPDDLVELTCEGTVHVRADGDSRSLLQSVVATTWAALDDGRLVREDAEIWRDLEQQLGLVGR